MSTRTRLDRPLTIEEYLALPPPTEEELAEARAAMDRFLAVAAQISASIREQLGRDMTDEEFWDLLKHDDDDDDDWGEGPLDADA
jgi:hypothetical protein